MFGMINNLGAKTALKERAKANETKRINVTFVRGNGMCPIHYLCLTWYELQRVMNEYGAKGHKFALMESDRKGWLTYSLRKK